MSQKIKIENLVLDKSFHERLTLNDDAIARYVEMYQQEKQKAIKIQSGTNRIIDGIHRYYAAKEAGVTELYADILDIPDTDLRLKAFELNKAHGVPLSRTERNNLIVNLYQEDGKTQQQIADVVELSQNRISEILSALSKTDNTDNVGQDGDTQNGDTDKRRKLSNSDKLNIVRLHLNGESQSIIADTYGISQSTVSDTVSTLCDSIYADYICAEENEGMLKREVAEKYGFTIKETDKVLQKYGDPVNFTPPLISFWPAYGIDNRFGQKHPGNIPAGVIRNLLYYFSSPGDHILDPFAGGGVVIDVVDDMVNRTVEAFDLSPIRSDINRHDILTGSPPAEQVPNLIILDPPYGPMKQGEYSESSSDLSSLNINAFIEAMAKIFGYWNKGTLILFMSSIAKSKEYYDLSFLCSQKMIEQGWNIKNRIVNQIGRTSSDNPLTIARAKKNRYLHHQYVDIIAGIK